MSEGRREGRRERELQVINLRHLIKNSTKSFYIESTWFEIVIHINL